MDTQDEIDRAKALLDYDPETGVFKWKQTTSWRAKAGSPAGCVNNIGYVKIIVCRKQYSAHRMAWSMIHGPIPTGMQIDHANGDRADNRITNLRLATHAQNQQNRHRPKRTSKTGFLGVYADLKNGRYTARIYKNGQPLHLGSFQTPEEAHDAYLKAKREVHEFCVI